MRLGLDLGLKRAKKPSIEKAHKAKMSKKKSHGLGLSHAIFLNMRKYYFLNILLEI